MITQMTSWQVVEDGKIVDKPHLAILVDNGELDTLLAYLEAIGTDHSLEMRGKLLRFQGKIPAAIHSADIRKRPSPTPYPIRGA